MSEPRNARGIAIESKFVVRQQTAWMFVNEIMLDNLSFSYISTGTRKLEARPRLFLRYSKCPILLMF